MHSTIGFLALFFFIVLVFTFKKEKPFKENETDLFNYHVKKYTNLVEDTKDEFKQFCYLLCNNKTNSILFLELIVDEEFISQLYQMHCDSGYMDVFANHTERLGNVLTMLLRECRSDQNSEKWFIMINKIARRRSTTEKCDTSRMAYIEFK